MMATSGIVGRDPACAWAQWRAWGFSEVQAVAPQTGSSSMSLWLRQSPFMQQGMMLYSFACGTLTEFHTMDGSHNRNAFPHKSGNSKSKSKQGSLRFCLLRPLSLACRWPPSHYVLPWAFLCAQVCVQPNLLPS